jgi:2-hydroxychromene-2-carboxylate isomerase
MSASAKQPPAAIEFWFDFASVYSYLSTMRIETLVFAEDRDVDAPEAVGEALADLPLAGPPPHASALLAAAQLDHTKTRLRLQTEAARTRGIFGAPTFFVGREMFWGNDRLEDALALAAPERVRVSRRLP